MHIKSECTPVILGKTTFSKLLDSLLIIMWVAFVLMFDCKEYSFIEEKSKNLKEHPQLLESNKLYSCVNKILCLSLKR